MFFTLPETTFMRQTQVVLPADRSNDSEMPNAEEKDDVERSIPRQIIGQRPTISEIVCTFSMKPLTSEPIWKVSLRPIALIILPSALWASLVLAVSIGFLVAVSSNVSVAFSNTYGFNTWQIGVSMISGAIGSIIAIWFGGPLSDKVADHLTRRNGGIREPEMRLPAMVVSLVTGPLALILYGIGIGQKLHWICPVIGVALRRLWAVPAFISYGKE